MFIKKTQFAFVAKLKFTLQLTYLPQLSNLIFIRTVFDQVTIKKTVKNSNKNVKITLYTNAQTAHLCCCQN